MALTSIQICSKGGESYSVQIFWWVGKGRREIPISCVWTIALPMKLPDLVKCSCPGQHSHRCQVNWPQRNRCHFTSLFASLVESILWYLQVGKLDAFNKKKKDKKNHYLDVGFSKFPNKSKPASLQVQSWQFHWDLIKPSPGTARTHNLVHWNCSWRNSSPFLMDNTMEFQHLPSMPRTSNYLIWT